jgi:hypothetical protein
MGAEPVVVKATSGAALHSSRSSDPIIRSIEKTAQDISTYMDGFIKHMDEIREKSKRKWQKKYAPCLYENLILFVIVITLLVASLIISVAFITLVTTKSGTSKCFTPFPYHRILNMLSSLRNVY